MKRLLFLFLWPILFNVNVIEATTSCLVETTCSRVEALIDLEISCCDLSKTSFDALFSDIDALTGLQQSCCADLTSQVEVLTNLELSCCGSSQTSFDDLFSNIDALTGLQQSCCADLTSQVEVLTSLELSCCGSNQTSFDNLLSNIDALTGLQESCCTTINSNIDVLTVLQETCCDQTLSAFDLMTTGIEILFQGLEFIGSEISVLSYELEYAFEGIGSILEEIQNCTCCQYEITPDMITAGGYTITNSGIYCLASDVVYVNGPAITITAPFNQVILDLGGHTITQDPFIPGTGPTIVVNGSGGGSLIIRNGATSGGDGHIILNDAQFTILQDLRLNYTTSGYSSVQFNNCNGVIIDNVEIRNVSKHGFEINNSVGCVLKNCLVEQCSQTGVFMTGCMNCSVENVKSYSNGTNGFSVEQTGALSLVQGILYKECVAENNSNCGFLLQTDDDSNIIAGVTYQSCFASGNSNFGGFKIYAPVTVASKIYDISYENCVATENNSLGFGASGGAISNGVLSVVYASCTAQGNTVAGFEADAQSILIKNCAALGNGTTGGISLTSLSNACQVLECNAAENIGVGVVDSGTNNIIYGNVASNNGGGNYTPSIPLQLKPTDITGSWINVDPAATGVGEYESKIDALIALEESCCDESTSFYDFLTAGLTTAFTGLFEGLGSAFDHVFSDLDALQNCACCQYEITSDMITAGGYTITTPGIYCLVEDVTYFNGPAITINFHPTEVILDLGGHTLTQDISLGTGPAIQVNGGGQGSLTIRNGAILRGNGQIVLNDAQFVVLENVRLLESVGSQSSIQLSNCDNIIISGVDIKSASNHGIEIRNNSIFCEIKNSTIEGSNASGVSVTESSNIVVENVQTWNCPTGFLINELVAGPSPSHDIFYKNCVANASGDAGYLAITDSDHPTIYNIFYENCVSTEGRGISGFRLEASGSNVQMIHDVTHTNCSSNGNALTGFRTSGASISDGIESVLYVGCQAQNNLNAGFQFENSAIIVQDCFALRNGSNGGINLQPTSTNCQVIGCTVSDNIGAGIDDTGTGNVVYGNVASNNGAGNYTVSVPLQLKPTDITGRWINVDPNATAVGEYESKIDALIALEEACCVNTLNQLNIIEQKIVCPPVMITNETVAGGGSYIIEKPGSYILCENIEFSSGFAISIQNSVPGVTLDLNGYLITGSGGPGLLLAASQGCIVRNGTISVKDNDGIFAKESNNIIIEEISIIDTASNGININTCSKVLIHQSSITGSGSEGIYAVNCNECSFEDLLIFESGSTGIYIDSGFAYVHKNIECSGNRENNFYITSDSSFLYDITYENCISTRESVNGFVIQNNKNFISSVTYQNCLATGHREAGFSISSADGDYVSSVNYKNCSAKLVERSGFNIALVKNITDIVFDHCNTSQISGEGFIIGNEGTLLVECLAEGGSSDGFIFYSGAQIIKSTAKGNRGNGFTINGNAAFFQKCFALENGSDGFSIREKVSKCQILNSYASNNGNIGINDNSGSSGANYVWGNSSSYNGTNYGSGASTPPGTVIPSGTYWTNVGDVYP